MSVERASYNGSIEASQASDVGSIPIARSNIHAEIFFAQQFALLDALAIAQQRLAAFLTPSEWSFSVRICDFRRVMRAGLQKCPR
jgi:hypothetical protein